MIVAFIIALGVGATIVAMIVFGGAAVARLQGWLDCRHLARTQVRRKLQLHRSRLVASQTGRFEVDHHLINHDVPASLHVTDPP